MSAARSFRYVAPAEDVFADAERQEDAADGGDEARILADATGCKRALAAQILRTYGDSLWRVVAAAERGARDIPSWLRPRIKALRFAVQALTRDQLRITPQLCSGAALLEYCRSTLAHIPVEEFHAIWLDIKNNVIATEKLGRGTVDHAPVYPREVVRQAIRHNASAAILVHNHPSGDLAPSRADIEMTTEISAALKTIGVTVHDHLVIGSVNHTSFRARGLL